jgi:hypothetical protein
MIKQAITQEAAGDVSSFLKFVWEGSEYVALLISQMGRK